MAHADAKMVKVCFYLQDAMAQKLFWPCKTRKKVGVQLYLLTGLKVKAKKFTCEA